MAYDEGSGPHRLTLEDRQHLILTGVTDVDSFDENTVLLRTNRGLVSVRGEGLQLRSLSTEGGARRGRAASCGGCWADGVLPPGADAAVPSRRGPGHGAGAAL